MNTNWQRAMKAGVVLAMLGVTLVGCPEAYYVYRYQTEGEVVALLEQAPPAYPDAHFVTVSDIHLYDTDLGTQGDAFQDYLAHDRKMLEQSEEILATVIEDVQGIGADFMIVSGDLTKDGEAVNHTLAAQYLATVEAAGTPVFVVPGNHDINNPDAKRFSVEGATPVATVTAEEFRTIYAAFGFDEALYEDAGSLSYVVEPVAGLWLLCLDSTDSATNFEQGFPNVGGAFSPATLAWIEARLIEANESGKAIIATMHHGVVPHWNGQEKFHPEYVVNHYDDIARMLAAYHVRCVFTGHYHSLDAAKAAYDADFVFDVETSSLVTYRPTYREIRIADNLARVRTHPVTAIPSIPTGFVDYARGVTYEGVYGIAVETLINDYGVPEEDAETVAAQVTRAFIAHYGGDESHAGGTIIDRRGIGAMGQVVLTVQRYVIEGLWTDSECADTNFVIDFATGDWYGIQ